MRLRSCGLLITSVVFALGVRADEPPPGQTWSGNFGAGLSLTRGNSDTKNVNLALNLAQRLSPKSVLKYDAFYLRSDKDGGLLVDRATFGARDEFAMSALTMRSATFTTFAIVSSRSTT